MRPDHDKRGVSFGETRADAKDDKHDERNCAKQSHEKQRLVPMMFQSVRSVGSGRRRHSSPLETTRGEAADSSRTQQQSDQTDRLREQLDRSRVSRDALAPE